jgi:hypothetical protein
MAIVGALESCGLTVDPSAAIRRPAPARTIAEQFRRIDIGRKVLAEVRQSVPVGLDDRPLIERFVDAACDRLEEADRPQAAPSCPGATVAAVIAYAAAGGGAVGSFESFHRSFVSRADAAEPVADPVVDRRDVKPAPVTNPTRGPVRRNPPGSPAPAKANPTRTIRSSRWTAGGKAARP